MSYYHFEMKCPRCGDLAMLTLPNREPPPKLNCGRCLADDAEIVPLTIVRVTVEGDA